jgi:hypothetical protein
MKIISFFLAFFIAGVTTCFAQCGKTFTITTSKTDHLDSKGNVTRTDDEKATVVIGKNDLKISVSSASDDHQMTGLIQSDSCSWPVPYKEGVTVIKATISDNGGDRNVTITITGKGGKVTLLFETEGEPDDRIRVTADKFE